jgi:hypothetical protein
MQCHVLYSWHKLPKRLPIALGGALIVMAPQAAQTQIPHRPCHNQPRPAAPVPTQVLSLQVTLLQLDTQQRSQALVAAQAQLQALQQRSGELRAELARVQAQIDDLSGPSS